MIGFKKALVTGANGFIGAHLCKLLLSKGVDVDAMVRKTSDLTLLKQILGTNGGGFDKLNPVYGDVTDIESLKEAISGEDVVFNIAGVIKGLSQEDYDRINVEGAINVCKAAVEVNPSIKRLVFISSSAAGGPTETGVMNKESDPVIELNGDYYGISKHRMEVEVLKYYKGASLPVTIARPPTVMGAGDTVSLDLFKLPKKGYKLVVGKKPKYYSIVDVRDLCSGLYALATNDRAIGEILYFTTGEPVEWGELQEIIGREVFNRTKPLKRIALPPGITLMLGSINQFFGKIRHKAPFLNKPKMLEGVASGWSNSREKAENLLDWHPEYTIESMVRDAGEWYKANGFI